MGCRVRNPAVAYGLHHQWSVRGTGTGYQRLAQTSTSVKGWSGAELLHQSVSVKGSSVELLLLTTTQSGTDQTALPAVLQVLPPTTHEVLPPTIV